MKKYLFFVIVLAVCELTINAQTKNELQIGLAIPQSDFADDDEEDAIYDGSGVAATGVYVGYKMLSPLKTDGLFWTFNAGIMYNDLQSDFKDDLEDYLDNADDYSLPKYINIPLLAGLQYEIALSEGVRLYGEGGIGINILQLTKMSQSGDDYEMSMNFKPSPSLAFKIGAGIVLQEKYTIGLNYMNLGAHKVKYKVEAEYGDENESDDDKFEKALAVSSMNITFGIRF